MRFKTGLHQDDGTRGNTAGEEAAAGDATETTYPLEAEEFITEVMVHCRRDRLAALADRTKQREVFIQAGRLDFFSGRGEGCNGLGSTEKDSRSRNNRIGVIGKS